MRPAQASSPRLSIYLEGYLTFEESMDTDKKLFAFLDQVLGSQNGASPEVYDSEEQLLDYVQKAPCR